MSTISFFDNYRVNIVGELEGLFSKMLFNILIRRTVNIIIRLKNVHICGKFVEMNKI